jgi:hypothetical protein
VTVTIAVPDTFVALRDTLTVEVAVRWLDGVPAGAAVHDVVRR